MKVDDKRRYAFLVDKQAENDIIQQLEKKGNITEYLKSLIRKDIKNEKRRKSGSNDNRL